MFAITRGLGSIKTSNASVLSMLILLILKINIIKSFYHVHLKSQIYKKEFQSQSEDEELKYVDGPRTIK